MNLVKVVNGIIDSIKFSIEISEISTIDISILLYHIYKYILILQLLILQLLISQISARRPKLISIPLWRSAIALHPTPRLPSVALEAELEI